MSDFEHRYHTIEGDCTKCLKLNLEASLAAAELKLAKIMNILSDHYDPRHRYYVVPELAFIDQKINIKEK